MNENFVGEIKQLDYIRNILWEYMNYTNSNEMIVKSIAYNTWVELLISVNTILNGFEKNVEKHKMLKEGEFIFPGLSLKIKRREYNYEK